MPTFILILLTALVVGLITSIVTSNKSRERELEEELKLEREKALRRMNKKEAKKKELAKSSHNKAFWKETYLNKDIETIRVSEKQYGLLLTDTEFLSNQSGSYPNVKGMYRGKKVMFKLPARKGKKHGNSNKEAN